MISEEEMKERREAVEYAKASVGLEGITLSQGLLEIADEYVKGNLTLEEFGRKYELALRQGL